MMKKRKKLEILIRADKLALRREAPRSTRDASGTLRERVSVGMRGA